VEKLEKKYLEKIKTDLKSFTLFEEKEIESGNPDWYYPDYPGLITIIDNMMSWKVNIDHNMKVKLALYDGDEWRYYFPSQYGQYIQDLKTGIGFYPAARNPGFIPMIYRDYYKYPSHHWKGYVRDLHHRKEYV
jgi:hypothetical protein